MGTTLTAQHVTLIVSSVLDHSLLIARDHGPRYAESLGIPWAPTTELPDLADAAVIIESTINSEEEVAAVRRALERHSAPILLKIVDPYWSSTTRRPMPWQRDRRSAFARLVEDYCNRPNVGILSVYQPAEWLADIVARKNPTLLVLPYPYLEELERPLTAEAFQHRKRKVILSGSTGIQKYPQRHWLRWKARLWGNYRRYVDVLLHPGYPNTGDSLRHQVISDAYVEFLSGYQYMFLCGSRAGLEFLKYSECAYAGCVPVGIAPASLPDAATKQFISVPGCIARCSKTDQTKANLEAFGQALAFRTAMRAGRNSTVLRKTLNAFVEQLSVDARSRAT